MQACAYKIKSMTNLHLHQYGNFCIKSIYLKYLKEDKTTLANEEQTDEFQLPVVVNN